MTPLALQPRAMAAAGLTAFLLWHFSPALFGHAEAWDGNDARYLLCMLGIGVVVQWCFPAPPPSIYFATGLGALVGATFALGADALNPMAGLFVFLYALPALVGAWGVQRLRRR